MVPNGAKGDAYDTVGRVRLGIKYGCADDDGTCWGICSFLKKKLFDTGDIFGKDGC